jgi:festuclavine dehydrogenase
MPNTYFVLLQPTDLGSDNFTNNKLHYREIMQEDRIYSAAQDGQVPFVSANDIVIAAVAFHLLAAKKSYNTEHFIRGPDLLSYDEVR